MQSFVLLRGHANVFAAAAGINNEDSEITKKPMWRGVLAVVSKSREEVLKEFAVDRAAGLSSEEAQYRLAKYGEKQA